VGDVDAEDGVLEAGHGRRDGDEELVVPDGVLTVVEVDAGGALGAVVDPEHGVGMEVAVAPVDVLEVGGRTHGDLHLVAGRHGWN